MPSAPAGGLLLNRRPGPPNIKTANAASCRVYFAGRTRQTDHFSARHRPTRSVSSTNKDGCATILRTDGITASLSDGTWGICRPYWGGTSIIGIRTTNMPPLRGGKQGGCTGRIRLAGRRPASIVAGERRPQGDATGKTIPRIFRAPRPGRGEGISADHKWYIFR